MPGDHVLLPDEAIRLDAVADTSIDHLFARVVTAYPSIAGLPAAYQDRTREDLRWIVRFTGAAVLTGDPTVLDDFLPSLLQILHGRVPDDVLLGGAGVAADGVEPIAAGGADMLRADMLRARVAV